MQGNVTDSGERPSSGAEGPSQDELKGNLRGHYEEIIRNFALLLKRKSAPPPGQWPALIEYRLTSGVAYYYNEGGTAILGLEFPKELESTREQVREHMGASAWERWETLVRDTNSHLERVVRTWKEILEDMAVSAHEIGLFPYEKLSERPLDIYWPSMFLNAIWGDIGYYDTNKSHLWESAQVAEEFTAIPMRHTIDVVQTWVYSGLPWILTQSREAAESMKKAWEHEAVKVEPKVWDLLDERNRLEDKSREFLATLRRFEIELEGYHKDLPNRCAVCSPWRDGLERPTPTTPL